MVSRAVLVSEKLNKLGINAEIYNAAFIKPIDTKLIDKLTDENKIIVTIEDNILSGGFGQEVLSYVNSKSAGNIFNIGFKDEFVTHGSTDILYKLYGLDVEGITENIIKFYEEKINEQ
jgi:1-deoxy-D-xylulose-5-phosphate synthase